MPIKVFPIPGRFAVGDPMIEHEVEAKADADRLLATGAFALSAKEAEAQAWKGVAPTPATNANVKKRPIPPVAAPPAEES